MKTTNSAPPLFDNTALLRQQTRAAKNFEQHNFLHKATGKNLTTRILDINRDFTNVLNLETPIDETAKYDLITSNLSLHFVNDLPQYLSQIRRALKPDGLFLASLFGGQTLREFGQILMEAEIAITGGASPRIIPMIEIKDMGALLQNAGFAQPVIDSEILQTSHENISALMRDLRGMGQANCLTERRKNFTPRHIFTEANKNMPRAADGRIHTKFEILYCLGWAPHKSQQQPLQRGSAKHSMAKALSKNTHKNKAEK